MTAEAATGGSVSVVVSRHVPTARTQDFEALLNGLLRDAAAMPGHGGCEVLHGPPGAGGRDYWIVFRFRTEAELRAWDASPARLGWLRRIDATTDGGGRQEVTGLERWFTLPGARAVVPPPRSRMAAATWLGIWPTVSLLLWALAPVTAKLPFLVSTALVTGVAVVAMTYLVMPHLSRWLAGWLYPGGQPSLPAPTPAPVPHP